MSVSSKLRSNPCQPTKIPETINLPPNINTPIPCTSVSDDFNLKTLARQWQWNHNPIPGCYSLTARPGWLRLTTGHLSRSLSEARNTLTQRSFGPKCTGATMLDVTHMKNGDYAGLAALQDQYGLVGIKMVSGKKYVIMSKAPDTGNKATGVGQYELGIPETEIESIPLEANQIYIKLEFLFEDGMKLLDEASFYYSLYRFQI